jgi:hypothetical protein
VKPGHALRALHYASDHSEIPAVNHWLLRGVRATLALSRAEGAQNGRRLFASLFAHIYDFSESSQAHASTTKRNVFEQVRSLATRTRSAIGKHAA